ncbi:MAG: M23 family metallopeptidase [Propionibacteriaceae bacterium]|nr:M23 family metallopeptidase [Propionibacteriaceae bacterium]
MSSAVGKIAAGAVAFSLVAACLISFASLQSAGAGSAFADNEPAVDANKIGDLAKQRQIAMDQDGAEIAAKSSTETALANRQQQLADDNQAILNEADRLEKLTEFLWPTEGPLSPGNGYGMRYHPILHRYRLHDGIDITAKCSQPIYAAQAGTVVRVTSGYGGGSGNSAKIDHGKFNGDQIATAYLHMSKNMLKEGEEVEKGQLVGYVGSTGLSTGCHLHLSLYKNGKGTDPLDYVKQPVED